MQFTYSVDGQQHVYETVDVFGKIRIVSERVLNARSLDDVVAGILQSKADEGKITDWITFTFDKRPAWDESKDESGHSFNNPTEDIPPLLTRIINFIKRLW